MGAPQIHKSANIKHKVIESNTIIVGDLTPYLYQWINHPEETQQGIIGFEWHVEQEGSNIYSEHFILK